MKFIILPSKKGKTYQLIKHFEEDPFGILVTIGEPQKIWAIERYGIKEDRVFTVREVLEGKSSKSYPGLGEDYCLNLYIDDADLILQSFFPNAEIKYITINKEDNYVRG